MGSASVTALENSGWSARNGNKISYCFNQRIEHSRGPLPICFRPKASRYFFLRAQWSLTPLLPGMRVPGWDCPQLRGKNPFASLAKAGVRPWRTAQRVEKPSLVWSYNGPHQSAAGKITMYLWSTTHSSYHQSPLSGSCLIPGFNHLGFSPAPFSHPLRKQEGVCLLDITEEVNDSIIMIIKPNLPK